MSEQAKPVGASDKMKAKDFITLGIFTVLFFAVVMVCIFASAATVVTFAFGSAIAAIPGGIIYMLMRAKVPKAGSVLLSGVVIGLIEFLIGAGWAVAVGFIAGAVIAELLARIGHYKSFWLNTKPVGDDVAFHNVSFSYTGDVSEKALENVSFSAKQGQITAIVGPSGGGKSTIANLISRFWDVSSGSITIGGVDVRDMAEDDLMRHVSFVFQDIFLFKQSILDNIRMGNPSASEEQVIAAAKAAQCHEFISKLPGGYHTVVGSKGIHLSGGERQRIAIARAIIKDSPIIVLDEATAFSDPENEYLIQKAFEKLMQGKTVIIIAHRLSTIRNADKIIVMEKGHLIEEGKHDELVAAGGRYAQMWNHYTEAIGWKISGKAV